MNTFAWVAAVVLSAFTVRRYVFWFASLAPRRGNRRSYDLSIAVLVAARNEERALPGLLAALAALDYPAERLSLIVVSDGSTDDTPKLLEAWSERAPGTRAIILPVSVGKGAALQVALRAAPACDLVAVLDADTLPRPTVLAELAGAFDDPAVGAACGYPDPGVGHATIPARYAALERWATHLVTIAGKDRLRFQPPMIGALCAVRRTALEDVGGFPDTSLVEDIHVSMALTRRGWKCRWIGAAVARKDVPTDLRGFRRQRLRWSRGLMGTSLRAGGLEDLFVAAGYLDRLVFAASLGLALFAGFPWWLPAAYAAAPIVVVLTALWRADPPHKLRYLWAIVPMTIADIAVTLEGAVAQVVGAPRRWKAFR